MIEDVILTTENCRYCLMCRHVCPVGHVTRLETLTPHGWGLTISSIRRGSLAIDESTVNAIYSCADCGTCRANCVTDQPLPSAIAAMRAEIAAAGQALPAAYEIQAKLETWGNPYAEQAPEAVEGTSEAALFVGDDAHYLGTEAVEAALRLLEAVGVKPILIGVGRNNGYLASSLGFPQLSFDLALATLAELESTGASSMMVLTPGDYYVFRQMHDERHGLAWPSGVSIQEVIPFLSQNLAAGNLRFKRSKNQMPYAYVDPTHAVRVGDRHGAPRQLLAAVMPAEGQELFWRRERAHPSGNVALQYTKPHIADHLAYSRLADAMERGARLLITEDPGGRAHLARHAPRFGLEVAGLYELLAEHLE
ncbi:MAG TPA: (Fe-S)-binding protein [Anaerolineae bacterium]|nr:(Fe-S)-binding protein [Anaerolineae bacterium]